MNLKPQDVLVILKMISKGSLPYGIMAKELGMSAAEVHAAVDRSVASGFVNRISDKKREVRRNEFFKFLTHGIANTFPAKAAASVIGVPTAHAAPPLNALIVMPEGDLPYVWPDVDGTVRGFELPPLYKSVPKAAKQDPLLYELLALIDALRIGRARERGIAMKELKKRIFPTDSFPVNIGPWGINETTIKDWVGAFTGSEQILPDLIRRLVLFLIPCGQLAHAHFPAGKEVHQSGSDGEFITRGLSIFAPQTEQSVWEISTEKDISGKLKKDYDAYLPSEEKKQKKLPAGMEQSTATYVAVTGRIADEKAKKWLEEKKAEGQWADVRLYDAVDIAQWLALAPAVSSWFREVLGNPQDGLFSVEEYFNVWAHRPERLPPLTERVVLAGRKNEQEALVKRLMEHSERIRVHSDDPDESFVFLCAVILSMPEDSPERTDLLARTMIVTSSEAWSRLLKQIKGMSGLILVPAFDEYDGNTYGCAGHIVYMRVRDGAEIELKPIDREALGKALWGMMGKVEGGEDEARKKAYDCGGRLSSLQRLHGYQPPLPDWAHDANIHVMLSSLLLCGAWRPDNPNDRAILEKLSNGRSYTDMEALVQKLMNQVKDPPLRTQSYCIKWRSSQDAWGRLVKIIIPTALERFYSVCAEVLGKDSPRYNLSPDDRLLADTEKKTLPESDELRNGLAESLAMLRVMAGQLPKPSSEADVHRRLDSTVKAILSGGTWKRWASLGSRLPDLAEAAPVAFLDALDGVLAKDSEGMKPLFGQESSKYDLFSEFCQAGLLWALELLAWNPAHFSRAVYSLVRLCALDTGKSNTTHRPENCLFSLFDHGLKQTAATNQQRLAALRKMDPFMQWKVVSHVLYLCIHGGYASSNHRPKFSSWEIPCELELYSSREVMEFIQGIQKMAEDSVKTNVNHLIELFNNNGIEMIVDDAFRIMGERLDEYRRQGSDLLNSLCQCLRRWMAYQYLMYKDDLPEERILVAKNLIEQLEQSDVVERNAWLFSQNATVPEPIEWGENGKIREQWLDEQRRAALLEVLQGEDAFHRLLDLARKAPSPYLIAWSLTSADVGDPFERDMICEALPQEGKINELARSFCRRIFLEKGAEWALDWARQLNAENKGILLADFLAVMDSIPEFRTVITSQSDDIQSRYWEKVNLYKAVFHDPDDFSNTVKAVLNAGRWDQALLMALASLTEKDHLVGKASDYLNILRYPLKKKTGNAMEPENPLFSLSYVLAKIFLWLDTARGGIKREDLAMLEVCFFDVLNHSERKPHHIWQQMAENPAFFAQLVSMMFWTASDSRPYEEIPESEKEQYEKRAEVSFKLLYNWKGHPGEGKPAEERDVVLRAWCDEVLELTKKSNGEEAGQVRVGEVLARVRVSAEEGDGVWPCRVARDYIEGGYEAVARGIATGRFNSMGMISFTVDKAGQSEREWALAYRDAASKIRDDYPMTARMLEALAEKYQILADIDVRDMEKYTDP